MSDGIEVRACKGLEEYRACVALQRAIWGEDDLEIVPDTIFVVAEHTGGQILGAFDGGKLVGFTLAMASVRYGAPYLHSHMTGVLAEYRDRGVGRMLKLFQREEALSREIRLIEWTFDPLEMRNAHFNLNRLGAVARRYLPNLYGITSSPLHRGLATDRLVAEWYLDSPRALAALSGELGVPEIAERLPVPRELEKWKSEDTGSVAKVQAELRVKFGEAFAKGYAAVGVRQTAAASEYHLAPRSEY